MTKDLLGKLFGDKGYLSHALFKTLYERGLEVTTSLRKNMKGQLTKLSDKLLYANVSSPFVQLDWIETITDQLKNISQIEHARHR